MDIFLPICGEPIEVLRNTWTGVFELIHAYPGVAYAFVLDDGDSDEAAALAPSFGFTYRRRPERQHKKAGNLNYGFRCTSGEHIVVFDADFRPRPDFLLETLPYLDDPAVGLVQTPQYFRVSKQQTWVERCAGASLEIFYRSVQVSRDRFGSALCVGSNAVYRRAALAPFGGFTEIPYAEDSHTGLDTRRFRLRAGLPTGAARGGCLPVHPGLVHAPAVSLVLRRDFAALYTPHVACRDAVTARLPYISGWLWNLTTGLRTLVLPLIPITLLAFLPSEIRLHNAILLIPPVITGTVLYPLWHNAPYSPRIWSLAVAVGWAQVLRDLGLLTRQGYVLAAVAGAGRCDPPVLAGRDPLERHAGRCLAEPGRLADRADRFIKVRRNGSARGAERVGRWSADLPGGKTA